MPPHQRADDGFPAPSMQPISVDFIENRYEGFRNAEGELSCQFDPRSQKFVAPPFAFDGATLEDYESELRDSKLRVVATKESFANALAALKRKKSKEKKIASFDLDSFHDWKEITDLIQVVVKDYHKDDSTWAHIRGAFRRVGDNAKSIQAFVGLLPDGEYKTLCGGLTLILTAMTEHAEIRQRMADLLREVPDIVNKCEQYQTLYTGRNTIQLCINDIYHNLLVALETIVDWYKQSSWKHAKDSLFKNNNYGMTMDQCLQNIRQSKSRFTEETQLYLAISQQATLQTTRVINSNVLNLGGRLSQAETNLQNVVNAGINSLMGHLDDRIKNAEWQNNFEKFAESWMERQFNVANDKQRILELEEQVAKTAITSEYLIKELRLNQAKHTHVLEVSMVLKDGLNSSTKFQNRAGWVGNTTQFLHWLGGPNESQILCVQGRGEVEKTSPLSFLISLLYEKLEKAPRTLVLPFFCGRSKTSSGPAIMLRALFVQLLVLYNTHEHIDDRARPLLWFLGHDDVAEMKDLCPKTYTKVLTQLLQELRKEYSAIFILIDAVEFYDSEWEEEMDDFVKSMRKLVKSFNKPDDETPGGVLRVLLTASSWSRRFSPPPKSLAVLDVPEYIDSSLDGFERFA